jgi:thiol-disulfide isomerase/thioredoxin
MRAETDKAHTHAGPSPTTVMAPQKHRGGLLLGVLAVIPLGMVALAVFGGSFGRGAAVGSFATVGVIAVVIGVLRRKMRRLVAQELEVPTLPSASWDYTLDAQDLAGEPVSFGQFRDRVVVLNFWATWCRPCVAEMPSLFRLRDATAEAGVVFAFLSNESPEAQTTFNAQHGWPGPLSPCEFAPGVFLHPRHTCDLHHR